MKNFPTDVATASILVAALTQAEREVISFDGSALVGPDPVINKLLALDLPAKRKEALLEYAAAKRFSLETGGLEIGGTSVRTDRESQALINGAFNMAKQDENFTTKFKGVAGFVDLNATQIIAIAMAVGAHVAACFAAEAAAVAAIESGNATTREHVDALVVV